MIFFLLLLTPSFLWGQSEIDFDSIGLRTIVELERDGETIQRHVMGLPNSKVLSQDADFTIRSESLWQFWSPFENAVCWMQGEHYTTPVQFKSDLLAADVLLDISLSDYRAAPALGDSLYFVHATNRPTIAEGATRTLAQGADSREWGTIHFNDITGIIEEDE